jgi:hypothetical protein
MGSMGRWTTRSLLGGLCLALVSGCSQAESGKRQAGGQSGVEGGCAPESDVETPLGSAGVSTLPFRPSQIVSLVEGSHTLPLHWAGWTSLGGGQPTIDVEIDVDAEAATEHNGCGTYVELPATLTLRSSDGLLELSTEGIVVAKRASEATIEADIPSDSLDAVAALLGSHVVEASDDEYYLNLRIDKEGTSGRVGVRGLAGKSSCDMAFWPEPSQCQYWTTPAPLTEPLHGASPSMLVEQLNELDPIPLEWDDGTTTTLSIEAEAAADYYCVQTGTLRDENGLPRDGAAVELPLRLHLVSADQRLDAWVPGLGDVVVDGAGQLQSRSLSAHAPVMAASTSAFDIATPDVAIVRLQLSLDDGRGELAVKSLSPESPPLQAEDISGACLNADYLGATTAVARASWVSSNR